MPSVPTWGCLRADLDPAVADHGAANHEARACGPEVSGRSVVRSRRVHAVPGVRRGALGRLGLRVGTHDAVDHGLAGHVKANGVAIAERHGPQWQAEVRENAIDDLLSRDDGHREHPVMAARTVEDIQVQAAAHQGRPVDVRSRAAWGRLGPEACGHARLLRVARGRDRRACEPHRSASPWSPRQSRWLRACSSARLGRAVR